jgi:hypothetical protein
MATPTIPNGEEYFFPIIYEGNGGGQRVGKFVPFTDNGTIANSCIFNDGDSPRLTRTPSSASNRRTATLSLWFKRGDTGADSTLFSIYDGSNIFSVQIRNNTSVSGGGTANFCIQVQATPGFFRTNRSFEDTSKFYHILLKIDTTDATESNRVRLYVDGDEITSFSTNTLTSGGNLTQNTDLLFNNTNLHSIGAFENSGSYSSFADGYLAEVNWVDGTALGPETFGVTDTSTGRWIPKTLSGITYGTNGFRLKFQDSSALGDDTSGNGNDLASTNLASTDQTTDSPTQNHATLQGTGGTLSEGNLKLVTGTSDFSHHNATLKPRSGKYYAEFTCDSMGRSEVGVVSTLNVPYSSNTTRLPATSDGSVAGYMYYGFNGQVYYNSSNSYDVTYATYTSTDIIGIALDLDNHTVQFFKNNSSQGTISLPNGNYTFAMGDGATGYSGGWTANFGQKSFTYTPPTGFVALQQDNLPTTDKGISDFLIIKNRDATDSWMWQDSLRGSGQYGSTSTATQYNTAITDGVQKFLAGGFSTEDNDAINTSGESYVAHNFHLNGGTTTTDTTGTLSTELQANATAGFSVGKFTVSGSGNVTWAHGLGGVPEMGILCAFDSTNYGTTYHHKTSSTPYNEYLLTTTDATVAASAGIWGSAKPTSTLWTGLANSLFTVGGVYVFYSFRSIEGFSKFSSYTGNGNADGPFVYLGFRPAYVMIKRLTAGYHWTEKDTSRNPINPMTRDLKWNLTDAENVDTNNAVDFLSNGFKIRSASGGATNYNGSGATHIYMAFAENPFVGDGTSPVTAR